MLANAVLLAADSRLTDTVVISRVLSGKTEDYEILVRRYNNLLYKTAHGILTKEEDIEDVMQEAYIRGFKKLDQFKGQAKFSTWLTRILINCALQQANKLKNTIQVSMESSDELELESYQEIPEDSAREEIGENLKKALEGAIAQLPTKYRIVFIMREVEQLPVIDVAAALNISEENVKIRLHRSKAMLKDLLRPKLNTLEIFEFHATRCAIIAGRVINEVMRISLP